MNVYTFLIRVHYRLLNAFISLLCKCLYKRITPEAKKVLLVRKGNLGDLVCSFPAFEAIKKYFPHATVDLLTTHGVESGLGASSVIPQGYFHKVYEYRSFTLRSLFAVLKQQQYDLVIELPPDVDTISNQLRNMIFFRLAGIRSGGGWRITRTRFLKQQQLKYLTFDSEQQRLKSILNDYGIPATIDHYPPLFTHEDLHAAKEIFQGEVPQKLVAIAVGAKLDKKKWPLGHVKEVVQYLLNNQYSVVAVGDETDYAAVESLGIATLKNACGKLSIAESAALLSLCTFTVCNDSGPMHLSYAVGTPVYAIFSARNYRGKWNPPTDGKNKTFVDYGVPCAGCMNAPCADNICMKQITPGQVIQSIQLNLHA